MKMKLLKAFLIFFIVFGIMYFFTSFILADFNFANWSEGNRVFIIITSFLITFFNYLSNLDDCDCYDCQRL